MNFSDLPTTKKGYIGEAEVDKYLISKGIVPYCPVVGAAHPFDRLCATADKKKIFVAECKAKASRTYYPDTGINNTSYVDYKNILTFYGIDVWLFFVDEYRKKIYGNLLTELEKPRRISYKNKILIYPLIQRDIYGKEIIYFPLLSMAEVCDISQETANQLKQLSRRNYGYADA